MNNILSEYIYTFKVCVIYILNCNEKSEKNLFCVIIFFLFFF